MPIKTPSPSALPGTPQIQRRPQISKGIITFTVCGRLRICGVNFESALFALFLATAMCLTGCRSAANKKQQNQEFFTSGNKEADQRASQRMAQAEQLSGSGEESGEKGDKKSAKDKE